MSRTNWEDVWEFNTNRFTVKLSVAPETDVDPSDHFEDPQDIELASEGGWHWFMARVQVVFRDDANPKNWSVQRDDVLGEDYLGGCSYHSLEDFTRSGGGYFREMVLEAIREARGKLARMSTNMRKEA